MSYIRSTSNPENLYIWDGSRYIGVMLGAKNMTVDSEPITVKDFNTFLRKYHKNFHPDICKYKGLKVEEVMVAVNDKGEDLYEIEYGNCEIVPDHLRSEFKMKLSYKDQWYIYMWSVTWEYIVYSNIRIKPTTKDIKTIKRKVATRISKNIK